MKYLTTTRFNEDGIWGRFDIAEGTEVIVSGDKLYIGAKPIVAVTSQKAHVFFTLNDDGKALERRELINGINDMLNGYSSDYQSKRQAIENNLEMPPWERESRIAELTDLSVGAFERIHADETASGFITNGFWNHRFFTASIADLEHVLALVKGESGLPKA